MFKEGGPNKETSPPRENLLQVFSGKQFQDQLIQARELARFTGWPIEFTVEKDQWGRILLSPPYSDKLEELLRWDGTEARERLFDNWSSLLEAYEEGAYSRRPTTYPLCAIRVSESFSRGDEEFNLKPDEDEFEDFESCWRRGLPLIGVWGDINPKGRIKLFIFQPPLDKPPQTYYQADGIYSLKSLARLMNQSGFQTATISLGSRPLSKRAMVQLERFTLPTFDLKKIRRLKE